VASTETVCGLVSSAWRKVDTGYTVDVTIPFSSTATIVFPKLQRANPAFSGRLDVGSGTHHFVVKEKE
jgi:hypothetical protein